MTEPKIVLFDLGSTLIHFTGDWVQVTAEADQAICRALEEAGVRVDQAAFVRDFRQRLEAHHRQRETEFIEFTTSYILKTTLSEWGYPQASPDLLNRITRAMYAVSQSYWRAEEDAEPTLKDLRELGYRLGLISNAGDDTDVQTLVDNANLRPFFDVILTSAACRIRKPNPRIFELALQSWNAEPERAIMVGDTLGADILGAHNAGLFSVWITRRADTAANRAHADTIQPDATIRALADLPALLVALNK